MLKKNIALITVFLLGLIGSPILNAENIPFKLSIDPFSCNGEIAYKVPASFPEQIVVEGKYRLSDKDNWKTLAIRKYRSQTAECLLALDRKTDVMFDEQSTGKVTELLAAGKSRTLIWQTYPDMQPGYSGDVKIQLTISDAKGKLLAQGELKQKIELKNLIILNDFTKLRPAGNMYSGEASASGWEYVKSFNPQIPGYLQAKGAGRLAPVIFRPDLKGYYAIFVSVPKDPLSVIQLRLSSDFYGQRFDGLNGRDYLWKTARMDNEHIVIMQPAWAAKGGSLKARLRYIKLVKLTEQQYNEFNKYKACKRDKQVFGYFEPYSWAFNEHITANEQFVQAVAAFKDAQIDYIDMQLGRLGAKQIYPSQVEEPLMGKTFGDAVPGGKSPASATVAQLALFTNPTKALMLASKAESITGGINFGAGINYAGGPLEGAFSAKHPEWASEKYFLQYKFQPVRDHLLGMYEENLKMGIKNIALDFGRYPRVIDKPEYATLFLKELRTLADKYSTPENKVKITVRFPVKGVRYERNNFEPEQWIKLKLVDTIIASGLFANIQYFDVKRYVKMTHNTGVRCLVDIDAGNGYHPWPGAVLERARQIYKAGADGIYIYQSDARIVGSMTSGLKAEQKRFIAMLGSSKAVNEMFEAEQKKNLEYSSGIYIFYPLNYQSCRIKVWIEGFQPETVEFYVNGDLVNRYTDQQQLYIVGQEGYMNNYKFINKPVTLKIRVKVNGNWIEQTHEIKRIFHSAS